MDDAPCNDLILLRSYGSSGDPQAFAELVRRYAGMVYATARRVTGDNAAAEDVSQDCFLKLAQRWAAVSGSLAAWLHRTSLNRSLELLRSEKSRRLREAEATRPSEPADDTSAKLIARVDEAIAALPERLRVVVTEHFLCGRTQAEMALMLGLNQATVSRRIERGVEQLRKRLGPVDSRSPLAALPLLLGLGTDPPAPEALRHSLVKIGLSGVRGGAAGTVSASTWTSVKVKTAIAGLLFTLAALALFTYWRNASIVGQDAPNRIDLRLVPPIVRATADAQAAGGTIIDVEKKSAGDQMVYEFDITIGTQAYEVRVASNGTLIWKKPN